MSGDIIKTIDELENFINQYKGMKVSRTEGYEQLLTCEKELLLYRRRRGFSGKIKSLIGKIGPTRNYFAKKFAERDVAFRSEEFKQSLSAATIESLQKNIDKYRDVYNMLEADSRETYISMLMFRITGNFFYVASVASKNTQYFSHKLEWGGKKHNIVDCGAFIGDTLAEFLDRPISINRYYLYELEDNNYEKMLKVCKSAESKGIVSCPRKKGVFSRTADLYFEADNDSSRLVDYETETKIPVVAIDDDVEGPITFIKMDIEGSEMEAINGAAKVIQRDKPTLAICIYHKPDDFWEIPLRIKEICPEYKHFWVEHYSLIDIETVLYATL